VIKKGIIVVVVLVLIQLIRPAKNDSKNDTNHISAAFNLPVQVEEILQTSCYDCHSNNTKKVWYASVAPISWMVANHVNKGKEHVNFSEWMGYNQDQKKYIVDKLIASIKQHTMPTKGYIMMHKDAALSQKQQQVLVEWFQTLKK